MIFDPSHCVIVPPFLKRWAAALLAHEKGSTCLFCWFAFCFVLFCFVLLLFFVFVCFAVFFCWLVSCFVLLFSLCWFILRDVRWPGPPVSPYWFILALLVILVLLALLPLVLLALLILLALWIRGTAWPSLPEVKRIRYCKHKCCTIWTKGHIDITSGYKSLQLCPIITCNKKKLFAVYHNWETKLRALT